MTIKKSDVICPECKGDGGELVKSDSTYTRDVSWFVACYYCAGTGYASDEDTFEEFYK